MEAVPPKAPGRDLGDGFLHRGGLDDGLFGDGLRPIRISLSRGHFHITALSNGKDWVLPSAK